MALYIFSPKNGGDDPHKTYANLIKIKMEMAHINGLDKIRTTGTICFNSKYKEKEQAALFATFYSYSDQVAAELKDKEKSFGVVSGMLFTDTYEVNDGTKKSVTKFRLDHFSEYQKSETASTVAGSSEKPF